MWPDWCSLDKPAVKELFRDENTDVVDLEATTAMGMWDDLMKSQFEKKNGNYRQTICFWLTFIG